MNEVNWEKAFKMLLAANYMGVWIDTADGHWWIEVDEDHEYGGLFGLMEKHCISIRDKVYDGPLQAIARIDAALRACGNDGLLNGVYTQDWYLGDGRESNEGVYKEGKQI